MPMIEIPAPAEAMRAFLDGYGAGQSVQLSFSLPVYAVSLAQLGNDGPITPEALGWQFLTIDQRGVVVGEVTNQPEDLHADVAISLTRGTAIDEAWKAYDVVKQHPEVLQEPFEFRRLRISPLFIDAFWLKAAPSDGVLGPGDRVYTFLSFEDRLRSNLLPAADFLAVVRQLAAAAMHAPEFSM